MLRNNLSRHCERSEANHWLQLISGVCFLAILVAMTSIKAHAKTLYVNGSTGNDSVSYAANGPSAPWRTIGRAAWGSTNRDARNGAEAARAGDLVSVAAGTYSGTGTQSRNEILYYTENNGTAGNPIIFRANGLVQLTQSGAGAMIGSYNRDFITWDGFTLNEASALSVPDTGLVTVYDANGVTLENLDINGNGDANGRVDNHTGIRIEGSTNVTVRNNRIQNVYTQSNPHNGACIQTYASQGLLIEHNELFNCGAGIFLKGGPWSSMATMSSTLRYNYIHDIGEPGNGSAIALHAGAPYTAQNPLYIYQNLIRNCTDAGFKLWPLDPTDPTGSPQYAQFINNTMDNCPTAIHVHSALNVSSGHRIWNNIITRSDHVIGYNDAASNVIPSRIDFEHNVYFTYQTFAEIGNGTRYTLASWQNTYNHDLAAPASINSDPLYSAGSFTLQTGSPARTRGIDYLDLNGNGSTTDTVPAGAYITGNEVIGINSGGTPPPPPPPPPVVSSACDINNNGSTNVTDVQLCANQAIGVTPCGSADINDDTRCDVIDVQRVVNAALGGACVTQ